MAEERDAKTLPNYLLRDSVILNSGTTIHAINN
jgi:hypothetical protein